MGKVRHIGVSNFSVALTAEAMQLGKVVSYQGLYNMLERNPDSYHNIPLDYRTERRSSALLPGAWTGLLPLQSSLPGTTDRRLQGAG